MKSLYKKFKRWLNYINQLPCFECGSRKREDVDFDYINHVVCEYTVICKDCGADLNYWAYGYYKDPNTYTELFEMKWYNLKSKVKRIIKNFNGR